MCAVPFFTLVFAIIDFGRYAITMQSLRMLADAGSRAMMVNCYTPDVLAQPPVSPSGCTGDPIPSNTTKQAVAPFLFEGGLTPTLTTTQATVNGSTVLQTTATLPDFTMLGPLWPASFNAPSAATSVPYK